MEKLKEIIIRMLDEAPDKINFFNEIRQILFSLSPEKANPVDRVLWVPMDMVKANNYNPNAVAKQEMQLLYTSIREDGYTQPIVTIWSEEEQKYIIVDGFHRNLIARMYKDIAQRNSGRLPIVVIDKELSNRMASTIRHNRARGKHSVDGMTNIIYNMIKNGESDAVICRKLGMEPLELVKLKHITGFAKMFRNYEYSKAIKEIVHHTNSLEL